MKHPGVAQPGGHSLPTLAAYSMMSPRPPEVARGRERHGRFGNRQRDLDSSRIHWFLENQTASIEHVKTRAAQSHIPL